MNGVSVRIHQHDAAVHVELLPRSDNGQTFFMLSLGSDCSIFLKGEDAAAIENARNISVALLEAANTLEFRIVNKIEARS